MSLPSVPPTQLPKARTDGKSMAQILGAQPVDPQPQPVPPTQNEMRMRAINNSDVVASLLSQKSVKAPETAHSEPVEMTPPLRSRKVVERTGGDATGKLIDLEVKMMDQERFNSFIMEQFNSLEAKFQKLLARGVLEGPSRSRDDGGETGLRLALLEEQLKKSERTISQLQSQLQTTHYGHSELGQVVSGLQRQEDSELSQIRSLIQDKITAESKEALKNKEKAQALFGEVVRLGEQQERSSDVLQRLGSVFEQRIQTLESRLMQGEQVYTQLNQRTDSGVNILAELADRVERRMQTLESALVALNSEQRKDQKAIDRTETQTHHLQEDVKTFMSQLQADIQHRLELRASDLLNRLLQEQEERFRNHEDLKFSLESKDRLLSEKLQFEREENRDKFQSLDVFVKTELQRKEEALGHLQGGMEAQIRSVYAALKQEEAARTQGEATLREEVAQYHVDMKEEFEAFKSQLNKLTDKLTEMIKTEVDCRLQTERELKSLIHTMIKGVMQEIGAQKEALERTKAALSAEIREASASFSEKADLISRYIDDELRRTSELMKAQHQLNKEMVTTLTENFKQNILTNEKWKGDANKRLLRLDQNLQLIKAELSKELTSGDQVSMRKLQELQEQVEQHLSTNTRILEERIDSLSSMTDIGLDQLDASLKNARELFANLLNKLNEEFVARTGDFAEDLGKVAQELEALQDQMDEHKDSLQGKMDALTAQLISTEAALSTKLSTEKATREHLINRVTQDFEDQCTQLEESIQKVAEQLSEEEKIQQGNDERNLEKFEELEKTDERLRDEAAVLRAQLQETSAEHRRDEAAVEAYLALQGVIARLERSEVEDRLKAEAQQRAEEDQTLLVSIEKQKDDVEELRKQQDAIVENARELVQTEYSKRIAAVHEDLRRERQRLWDESLQVAREELGEPTEQPQESQLVAMNNKVYRLSQKPEVPKPKVKAKP